MTRVAPVPLCRPFLCSVANAPPPLKLRVDLLVPVHHALNAESLLDPAATVSTIDHVDPLHCVDHLVHAVDDKADDYYSHWAPEENRHITDGLDERIRQAAQSRGQLREGNVASPSQATTRHLYATRDKNGESQSARNFPI
jgi:hypothetical protein